MFWCDIVGTLTFIYDLSYVNVLRRQPLFVDLEVVKGFPVSFRSVSQIERFSSLHVPLTLLRLRFFHCLLSSTPGKI